MSSFRKACIGVFLFCGLVAVVVETAPKSAMPSVVHVPPSIKKAPESPEERFKYAVGVVLKHEGGLSNDKDDRGGITKYGISLRFLKSENLDIDDDGDVDKDDIIHLDLAEADEIYAKFWWNRFHYNNINDLILATKIFDTSVNMGASQCHKILKRAMNHLVDIPIVETGDLNASTIALVNRLNPKDLLENFRTEEKDVYLQIVERNPRMKVFESGWLKRANE